jgi:DNA-binding NarL/FixJ family response regulator
MTAKRTKQISVAKLGKVSPVRNRYPFSLTQREQDVVQLVAKGLLDKEVADQLGISCGTVHNRMHSVFRKLGVGTRTEAAIQWLSANST